MMRRFSRVRRGLGWPVIFGNLTAILLALPLSGVAQSVGPAAPTATEYLNRALDLMQQNSINARKIDWMSLRRETLAHAAGAQTTYDTYDAIRFALQSLNDHHSFLQLSDELVQRDKIRMPVAVWPRSSQASQRNGRPRPAWSAARRKARW